MSRNFSLFTSDVHEAFAHLIRKRETGEDGWDMAEVRVMKNPPRTIHKYCVFRDTKEDGDGGSAGNSCRT